MLLLFAFTVTYCSYTLLCLSIPRHYKQVSGNSDTAIRNHWLILFRCCGWLLVAFSFALCIYDAGWQLGPVKWVGLLVATGLLLVFLLPYKPKTAVALGVIASLMSLLICLIGRLHS